MNKRIYLSPPYQTGLEKQYIERALESNWLAPVGPDLEAFEKEICCFVDVPYAAALSSGTAAIHLALLIAGISEGDHVICSTFTFGGSAFPITYIGATPVFVDSDRSSWNIDPDLFSHAVNDLKSKGKPAKAAIVVHLYGQSADLNPIINTCQENNIVLIEDAAESLGSFYNNKHTGSMGRFGILSFNGNKIITSSGGGMLIGQNKDDIDLARFYSTQARDTAAHYEHSKIGYNYRMSNIVAAIGRAQLNTIGDRAQKRKKIFMRYAEAFAEISDISFMPIAEYGRPNYWLTCITLNAIKTKATPEDIRLALESENIESRPLWKPMHLQPVFKNCPSYTNGVSENLFKTGLCLPSGTAMSEEDLNRVISSLRKAVID